MLKRLNCLVVCEVCEESFYGDRRGRYCDKCKPDHINGNSRTREDAQKIKDQVFTQKKNRCEVCHMSTEKCLMLVYKEGETKKFKMNISNLRKYSIKSIQEESDKCALMCLNCNQLLNG